MKKITTLFIILTISLTSFSQVVFDIISNTCNPAVVGTFPFEYAGELDGSSTDWGCPDITNPANAVQGCLVLVNDGSSGTTTFGTPAITVNNSVLGCDSTNWAQDLTGKIAVIFRGSCQFGLKAYNAQKRGAIGVIIINQTGTATGMAGSTYGPYVTIPVIQIGRADGDELLTCLDTICTGVVGFIGNSIGYYQNNMSSSKADILMTESTAIPWDLAQNGTEYPVDFGIWAYNRGIDPQTGVTATVDVVYNGVSVYTQTSAPVNFAAPDTTYLDSSYFDLGTYAPALWNVGTYTITYTINNTNEQYLTDNTFSFEFKLTNNDDIYAKCSLDNLNQPIHNTAYSLYETGCYFGFENCIVFKNQDAGTRNTMASGMSLSSRAIGTSIENQLIEIRAYQWNDNFIDITSSVTYNSLLLLDSYMHTYPDNTLNDANIYLAFNSPVALQDNRRYLFCVYNFSDSLRTGYNTLIDYSTTVNHYLQPISPVSTIDCSNNKTWYTNGFGFDVIPAISVTMDISTNVNEATTESTFYPYPNPASNLLTVPVRKKVEGKVLVEVFDLTGKLVLTENNTIGNEALKLNVASISNGAYLLKLTFANGTTDQFKISVNR
ncbi:MAG: PA domain-containing protein [Flavobacteriales bacterium]